MIYACGVEFYGKGVITIIKIFLTGRQAQISMRESDRLTTRSIGVEAHVDFSPDWDGLSVTANVYGSGVSIDALIGADGKLVIPHECLEAAGGRCKIAFQGVAVDDEGVVLRQVSAYADLGIIQKGMEPSGETEAPATLRLWEQIEANLANETSQRESSDAALAESIAGVYESIDNANEKIDAETNRATTAEQNLSTFVHTSVQQLMEEDELIHVEYAEADDAVKDILRREIAQKAPMAHGHRVEDIDSLNDTLNGHKEDISELNRKMGTTINDVNALEHGKQDKLVAGNNITIEGNVISATGGGSGGGAVESVNGKTGAVMLNGRDIKINGASQLTIEQAVSQRSPSNHNHAGVYQPVGDYALQSDIPTDDHINALIDAKVGTLESLASELSEVIG